MPTSIGHGWIHEVKRDGFRILARRDVEILPLSATIPRIAANIAKQPISPLSWGDSAFAR